MDLVLYLMIGLCFKVKKHEQILQKKTLEDSGINSKFHFEGSVVKIDTCQYLLDIHLTINKTKVLNIFDANKKCFIKIYIKSSPQEIWIRIRFLEID